MTPKSWSLHLVSSGATLARVRTTGWSVVERTRAPQSRTWSLNLMLAEPPIVVLEPVKMEQPIKAHKAGTVTGLQAEVGATLTNGAVILRAQAALIR